MCAATECLKCVICIHRFTHIGQIKGAYHGKQTVDGDPIVSISANDKGLHVRFSNKASIEDYYTEEDWYVDWNEATGEWVDVTISTVFGQSMEVTLFACFENALLLIFVYGVEVFNTAESFSRAEMNPSPETRGCGNIRADELS